MTVITKNLRHMSTPYLKSYLSYVEDMIARVVRDALMGEPPRSLEYYASERDKAKQELARRESYGQE